METLYYTQNDELLPVPVRLVRDTGYGAKIIESDYFYGQHSIDDSDLSKVDGETAFARYVTGDYKVALQRTITKIEKTITSLEARKNFFSEMLEKEPASEVEVAVVQRFGELRNVQEAKPKELRNLDLTLSLVGFLNHLEENGKLCVERSE